MNLSARRNTRDNPCSALGAAAERNATPSLVFQRRVGVGRSASLGASHQSARPGVGRATEVFAKLSFELDR